MPHRVYEILQRLQLEIEALAELTAGNPSASRSFGENRQKIRELLKEAGHEITFNPDPYLESYLQISATAEQTRRLAR